MKPIAMRCSEEQWKEIESILRKNNKLIFRIDNFDKNTYLVNNFTQSSDYHITNMQGRFKCNYGREVFEKWNMNKFLEYCDIEPEFVLPEKWCIEATEESLLIIGTWCNENKVDSDDYTCDGILGYYVHSDAVDTVPAWKRVLSTKRIYPGYTEITFEQFKKYVLNKKSTKMARKLTVSANDLLKLHAVVCSKWKARIATALASMNENRMVTVSEVDLDEAESNLESHQKELFYSIFGKKEKIDFDRIKTGSKVFIKRSLEICGSMGGVSLSDPVNVVFWRTPHHITNNGRFCNSGIYKEYCTFEQDGKYVLFASHERIDYITSVVEY